MKLYVGNLSFDTTEQQLESLFAEHGPVQSTVVVADRWRSRGFGFVVMSDDNGRAAIAALNGKSIDGRDLTVNEARPRGDGARGHGGRPARTTRRGG